MFRLHDNARRRICRAAFLLICVAPTVGVSLWCVRRHLPGVAAREARRLERELGLDVSLEGLRYLRPGRMLYEGLKLADPETGQLILQCRALEADWTHTTDEQGRPKATLVVIASQPEIEATGVDRLQELLGQLLRRGASRRQLDVRLSAGQLTLGSTGASHTLTELQGSIGWSDEGAAAEASFRLAGVDTPERIRVRLVRNRQTLPPASGFELDTGGGAVPCDLLALGLPLLGRLGPGSRLRGYIWANQAGDGRTSAGWEGELAGQLIELDLDEVTTAARLPHKLSGTAHLTIQSARFRRGRLEEALGTLAAGPGVISRSLIEAAVAELSMARGLRPQEPGDLVPYEQLVVGFLIDTDGLHLQGGRAPSAPGAILMGRQGWLLGEPTRQPQPVVALLRALVPASEVRVPATRQTAWLIGHLPVPQITTPPDAEATPPQARLRLGRGGPK